MEIVKKFYGRYDLINYIAKLNKAEKYLEIGVHKGAAIQRVNIEYKVGVDPVKFEEAVQHTNEFYAITSNEYFAQNPDDKFDIIFIDGLHKAGQVTEDINNSLERLNPGGAIVLHDMNPATADRERPEVNGDCWKAFVKFRSKEEGYVTFTIDNDQGLGVILPKIGEEVALKDMEYKRLTYSNLSANREEWLNLVSVKEGLNIIENHYG